MNWFGKQSLNNLECHKKENLQNGAMLIKLAEDINYFEDDIEGNIVRNIVSELGPDRFFDINNRTKKCELPEFIKAYRANAYK